jgi:hypothetical protein
VSTDVETDPVKEIPCLDDLTSEDLRRRWQCKFGRAAPAHLPKNLLLRIYAYRLQADIQGDLGPGTVSLLDRLGGGNAAEGKPIPLPGDLNSRRHLKTGTILVREHAGISHRVTVALEGYCWNGQTFSSLSQVATAITGTRWNGPRFFGIAGRRTAP